MVEINVLTQSKFAKIAKSREGDQEMRWTIEEIVAKLETINSLLAELEQHAVVEKITFLERNVHKAQAPIQVALSSCGQPICKYDQ